MCLVFRKIGWIGSIEKNRKIRILAGKSNRKYREIRKRRNFTGIRIGKIGKEEFYGKSNMVFILEVR